ncbi:MAG: hypothetical protein E7620_02660 [Ruminococcaceae bacterium]|nr:hypothetical protein [Oscillospiraceae bacterium]
MKQGLPKKIHSGSFREGHVQGIAVDLSRGHVYYSFTTLLVKTDLTGRLLGSVRPPVGHLGCITLDPLRRRVFASLELKRDAIGKGILQRTRVEDYTEDAFYLVSFDCDAIDRADMDGCADGVMRASYLSRVVKDYTSIDEVSGLPHRYGCSGIDGVGLGPTFGATSEKLMVAYGIYSDPTRTDNDHQVLLQYDPDEILAKSLPLSAQAPHHMGPEAPEETYFLFTGNTTYGIQNLEYDPHSKLWFAAVYSGKKPAYANFSMYAINGTASPTRAPLAGRNGETGLLLSCAEVGERDPNHASVRGCRFPLGQTGIVSLGNGLFYCSIPSSIQTEGSHASTLVLYQFDPNHPLLFREALS